LPAGIVQAQVDFANRSKKRWQHLERQMIQELTVCVELFLAAEQPGTITPSPPCAIDFSSLQKISLS
jgi:hypothetical protein